MLNKMEQSSWEFVVVVFLKVWISLTTLQDVLSSLESLSHRWLIRKWSWRRSIWTRKECKNADRPQPGTDVWLWQEKTGTTSRQLELSTKPLVELLDTSRTTGLSFSSIRGTHTIRTGLRFLLGSVIRSRCPTNTSLQTFSSVLFTRRWQVRNSKPRSNSWSSSKLNLTTRIVLARIKLLCLSRSTQSKSTKSVHPTTLDRRLSGGTRRSTLEKQVQLLALPMQRVRTTKKSQRNGVKVLLQTRYLKGHRQRVPKGVNWAHNLLWRFRGSKPSLKWSGPSKRIIHNLKKIRSDQ